MSKNKSKTKKQQRKIDSKNNFVNKIIVNTSLLLFF